MKIEIFKNNWSVKNVSDNPNKIFIFGDNNARVGKGGQAIIRDLPNTAGIRTKKGPNNKSVSFYNDNEFEQNCKNILDDILSIKAKMLTGKNIVFSSGGYGTGLANLSETAPKTFEYLCQMLMLYFGFDNKTGRKWSKIPSHDEISNGKYIDISGVDILKPINNSFFRSNLLEIGLTSNFELIKTGNKIAFTSKIKYKIGDILIFVFQGKEDYLVCKAINSIAYDQLTNWNIFEGLSDDFKINELIKTSEYYQTHFDFICTLNDKGKMVFKNDIFGDSLLVKKNYEDIDEKKKVKVIGEPIVMQNEDKWGEVIQLLKQIQDKLDNKNKKRFNPFRKKTLNELLELKGILGKVRKVDSVFSTNKYEVEFDNTFYYVNFHEGYFRNKIEIILTSKSPLM
jgi:hypothetical protein